jgi:hypothetical protein
MNASSPTLSVSNRASSERQTALPLSAEGAAAQFSRGRWLLFAQTLDRFASEILPLFMGSFLRTVHQTWPEHIEAGPLWVSKCMKCHRVRVKDGEWLGAEVCAVQLHEAPCRPKVCSDCARRAYARAAYANDAMPAVAMGDAQLQAMRG